MKIAGDKVSNGKNECLPCFYFFLDWWPQLELDRGLKAQYSESDIPVHLQKKQGQLGEGRG